MVSGEVGDEEAFEPETEVEVVPITLDNNHTPYEIGKGNISIAGGEVVITLEQAGGALQCENAMDDEDLAGG